MCGVMKVTGGAGSVLIFLLVLVAFGKDRTELMLYSVLMITVLTLTNPTLITTGLVFAICARIVYGLVGVTLILRNVGKRSSRLVTPTLAMLPYLGYMALVSAYGWSPILSYLKLMLFTVIFLALYSVSDTAATDTRVRIERLRAILLSCACYFIIGSVLLIPFPSLSTSNVATLIAMGIDPSEGTLFAGTALLSQTLGPIVGALATVLLADWLFVVRRWNVLYAILLGCTPILIYKTGSRTALGTLMAGLFFVALVFMQVNSRAVGARWKQQALTWIMSLGMFFAVVLLASPGVREGALRFLVKYTTEGSEMALDYETLSATRQGAMEESMNNFKASPWIGNGFQVTRQYEGFEAHSWKQLLSAPIEKGVWVTAVLEEGGIFGMALFVLFLLSVLIAFLSRRAYIGASAFVVLIVSNLGEFTVFSMTATGGFLWSMVFLGVAMDANRLHSVHNAMLYPAAGPYFAGR